MLARINVRVYMYAWQFTPFINGNSICSIPLNVSYMHRVREMGPVVLGSQPKLHQRSGILLFHVLQLTSRDNYLIHEAISVPITN